MNQNFQSVGDKRNSACLDNYNSSQDFLYKRVDEQQFETKQVVGFPDLSSEAGCGSEIENSKDNTDSVKQLNMEDEMDELET